MEKIAYVTIDKTTWPDGPWQSEYDKAQWQDIDTGLVCLIVRNSSFGSFCGYVGVTKTHPAYGASLSYSESEDKGLAIENAVQEISVHGGLTFSDVCQQFESESVGVCHIPVCEPDEIWWFGFDCSHYNDFSPCLTFRFLFDTIYRDVAYVEEQCCSLARQLAAIK